VKTCNHCGVVQPLSAFPKNKNTRDGLLGQCKSCKRVASRAYERTPEFRARMRENTRRWKARDIVRYLLTRARARCKKSGLAFEITADDVALPEACPLLGLRLERGVGEVRPNSPSLDRIDSSKGYVPGNVWIISRRANTIKSDATVAELEAIASGLRAKVAA